MNSVHHLTQSMASRGAAGPLEEESFVAHSPTAGGYMESQKLCAYNQTRECFLGLDVTAADLSYASLKELVATLALKSGEGLWLNPFKGIPEAGIRMPLDLVYLDENCRVIDAVESFPTFRVSPSRPPAVSVLVLPTHSVYSSQTQPGDLMVLCMAEEIGLHAGKRCRHCSKRGALAGKAALERGAGSGATHGPVRRGASSG